MRAGTVIARAIRVGADSLLIELTDPTWVFALDMAVRTRWSVPHESDGRSAVTVRDIVPGACTLLIDGIDAPELTSNALVEELASWPLSLARASAGELVEVPVVFDGPDLEEVADRWGVTAADAVAEVVATEFRAAFGGFAPGFAYLSGLPEHRAVPRRPTPRTRVPANAFGLAGDYAGIYPRSSPGGWQLLGTAVGVSLWDETRDPPALLTPGTRVRVIEAHSDQPGGRS